VVPVGPTSVCRARQVDALPVDYKRLHKLVARGYGPTGAVRARFRTWLRHI
jgi:hypothetical protein